DGFVVHSYANDDWQTCRDHVSARLGLDSERPATKPAPIRATPQLPDDTIDRIGWARSLWRATLPAKGTLAERYLVETRRLELPNSAAIRFHPRLKFSRNGEFLRHGGYSHVRIYRHSSGVLNGRRQESGRA